MKQEAYNYEMFSSAGSRACQSLVNSISKKILGPKHVTKEQIQELYNKGREKIALKHGEVFDTEPRWHIARRINIALKQADYGFKINEWGEVETSNW